MRQLRDAIEMRTLFGFAFALGLTATIGTGCATVNDEWEEGWGDEEVFDDWDDWDDDDDDLLGEDEWGV